MFFMPDMPQPLELPFEAVLYKKETSMKNYVVQGGYYFETEAEAVKEASRRAVKLGSDLIVFKAIKSVAPKTPEVDITDIKL